MEKKNFNYVTVLSVISAIAVVFLHTNSCFWTFRRDHYWASANIIESVFYFAVPVFFMISGATLIDYMERYSTKVFLKKRFKKTVIPFLVWSVVGLVYQSYRLRVPPLFSENINLKYVFNGILKTSFVSIYWFFPVLFCVYLCMPLFASVYKAKRKEVFEYLLIVGFICNILIPFINKVFNLNFVWPFSVSVISGYLFYVILGAYLSHYEIPKYAVYAIYGLSILGLALHMVGTYVLSMDQGKIVTTFKDYTRLPCIMYSGGIFLFFMRNSDKIMKGKVERIFQFLSKYTFALYLMHYYIMDVLSHIFKVYLNIPTTSLIYRLGTPVIIVIIVLIITAVIRKIKFLRWIVPN